MRRTYAEELELINDFRERTPPVDVELMIRALGIGLERKPLDPEVSGYISCDPSRGRYSITVNSTHPWTRQRFTMAHELGHYMRHRSILGEGVNDTRAYRTSSSTEYFNGRIKTHHETEANQFAANVLMPIDMIVALQDKGITEVQDLADKLGVSEAAMRIRLEGLERYRLGEQRMMRP